MQRYYCYRQHVATMARRWRCSWRYWYRMGYRRFCRATRATCCWFVFCRWIGYRVLRRARQRRRLVTWSHWCDAFGGDGGGEARGRQHNNKRNHHGWLRVQARCRCSARQHGRRSSGGRWRAWRRARWRQMVHEMRGSASTQSSGGNMTLLLWR